MTEHQPAPDETKDAESGSAADAAPRRGFLVHAVTAFLSFVLVAVPSAIATIFYLDPLFRKKSKAGQTGGDLDGFVKLDVTVDALPEDGTPVAVTVKADMDDAWNRFKDVPVGSVWLRKQPDGTVLAFNSVCPHLGCSVNFRRSERDFFCPCHTSSFDLDGHKKNEVPPRDMDSLEVRTASNGRASADGSELWIRFQNFKGGRPEKVPV